jgi:hypothetical protein
VAAEQNPPVEHELRAWAPWLECLEAFRYLSSLQSPAGFQHWRIYWVGSLTLLKTVRDVLEKVDRKRSKHHAKAIHDFVKDLVANQKNYPIYWNFVCHERNNAVHEFDLAAVSCPVTSYTMMDRGLSYQELVKKYGERKMITWGADGEDGLRLFEIALGWWEINLRIIEQAAREGESLPFSSGYRRRDDLANASFKHRRHFDYSWERGAAEPPRLCLVG